MNTRVRDPKGSIHRGMSQSLTYNGGLTVTLKARSKSVAGNKGPKANSNRKRNSDQSASVKRQSREITSIYNEVKAIAKSTQLARRAVLIKADSTRVVTRRF